MTDRVCNIDIERDGRRLEQSTHSLGEEGDFHTRVTRNRCGMGRAFVVTISVSSNIKRDLLALSVELEAGN